MKNSGSEERSRIKLYLLLIRRGTRSLAVKFSRRQQRSNPHANPDCLSKCGFLHAILPSGTPRSTKTSCSDCRDFITGVDEKKRSKVEPGSSLTCPSLPPHHPRPGSLAPHFSDHGPSDSALGRQRLVPTPPSRGPARGLLRSFSGPVLGRAPLGATYKRGQVFTLATGSYPLPSSYSEYVTYGEAHTSVHGKTGSLTMPFSTTNRRLISRPLVNFSL